MIEGPYLEPDPVQEGSCASSAIYLLTLAIQAEPNAPVNYLLRGEEWLARGEEAQARLDFETARSQAEPLQAHSAWGYVYQAYVDRAETGLRRCDLLARWT